MMRAKNKLVGAIGAAVGLVMAVTAAIVPASAAPTSDTVTSTMSCASFEGRTVTAPSVKYTGVGLRAGETISVKVSPATSGDKISLFASIGLSFIYGGGSATQTYAFTSSTSTVYSLSWKYILADNSTSTLNRTWTFDCSTATAPISSTTAPDDDRDGVANTSDSCSGTILPDSVSPKLAGKYYANASKKFVDGTGRLANITVAAAGGCSATQIAKGLGLTKSQSKSGITLSQLTSWANTH